MLTRREILEQVRALAFELPQQLGDSEKPDIDQVSAVLAGLCVTVAKLAMTLMEEPQAPRFVQIGDVGLAVDHITNVHCGKATTLVWIAAQDGDAQVTIKLEGSEHDAFLAWWNTQAGVLKLGEG